MFSVWQLGYKPKAKKTTHVSVLKKLPSEYSLRDILKRQIVLEFFNLSQWRTVSELWRDAFK